ncbi:MAG: Uma2 family endonuclease [Chloroflexota bacterium]|nr:Uma2 family endonuclease [Chloroflexota bacterium]
MTEVSETTAVYGWSPTIPDEIDGQLLVPLPEDFELTEEWWEWLRHENRHVRIELTPERELRVAMVSNEGSFVSAQLLFQIELWVRAGGGGMVLESAAAYDLPSGFRKRPDCSWVSPSQMPTAPRPWRQKFDIVGDFVVEVRSPRQSILQQQEKMVEWIEGGVRLGWLIDPFERKVWIYRANGEVDELDDPTELSGEDVCSGLVIDMSRVWD